MMKNVLNAVVLTLTLAISATAVAQHGQGVEPERTEIDAPDFRLEPPILRPGDLERYPLVPLPYETLWLPTVWDMFVMEWVQWLVDWFMRPKSPCRPLDFATLPDADRKFAAAGLSLYRLFFRLVPEHPPWVADPDVEAIEQGGTPKLSDDEKKFLRDLLNG